MNAATKLPGELGPIHFIGIGGIGMSGIAEVLINLGYKVQGSDIAANANVKRLRALGINVAEGHAAENLGEAEVVVGDEIGIVVRQNGDEIDCKSHVQASHKSC